MKKIYQLEIFIFCKMHDQIPFFVALRSSVRRFQMPFEGLSFVKMLVKFGIVYATDPLLQNKNKFVCLCWLTFEIFNYKPL